EAGTRRSESRGCVMHRLSAVGIACLQVGEDVKNPGEKNPGPIIILIELKPYTLVSHSGMPTITDV
ncbi:hypothetical protein, partial [Acidihalobacter prosperus]